MSKSRTSTKKKPKKKATKKKAAKKKKPKAKATRKAAKRPASRSTASRVSAAPKPAPRLVPSGHAGVLMIVSGPSGAGKSTLARRLSTADSRIWRSVSMTTRMPRPGEMRGIDYLFMSRDEFERSIAEGALLEYAKVHDEYYGTPRAQVVDRLAQGRDVLLEIDVQGALQVKPIAAEAVLVFVTTPSRAVLERRLRDRQSESEERVQARLAAADAEIAVASQYDYYVVNDDLDKATADVLAILAAERNRVHRRPSIPW